MVKVIKIFDIFILIYIILINLFLKSVTGIIVPILVYASIIAVFIIWITASMLYCKYRAKDNVAKKKRKIGAIVVICLIIIDFIVIYRIKLHDSILYVRTPIIGPEMCKEIVECFNDEDASRLRKLFCKSHQGSRLNLEIEEALDLIDGNIISYDISSSREGSDVQDGRVTDVHFYYNISDIKTDTGNSYFIGFGCQLVDAENRRRQGIYYMWVEDTDSKEDVVVEGYYYE